MIVLTSLRARGCCVIPSKFIAYEERRLGRPLTVEERATVLAARESCSGGKRDTVKAMRVALEQYWASQA